MSVEPFTEKDYLGIVAPARVRSVSAVLEEGCKTRSSTRTLIRKFIIRTETHSASHFPLGLVPARGNRPLLFRSSSSALFTDGAREPFELRSEVVVLSRNLNGLASRFAQPAIQLFRGEGYLSDLSNRDLMTYAWTSC